MILRRRAFWFWIATALVIVAAVFLFADRNLPLSTSQTVSGNAPTSTVESTSKQPQISEGEKIQQVINSDPFAPPPGNTEKRFSMSPPFQSPFHSAVQTARPETLRDVPRTGQEPQGLQQGGTMILGNTGDKAPTSVVKQNDQPASKQTPGQAQNQPMVFETPPGVGSVVGGR